MKKVSLLDEFKSYKIAEKLSVESISKEIDINADKIRGWLKRNGKIMYEDGLIVKNWLNVKIGVEKNGENDNILNDDGGGIKCSKLSENADLFMQSIVNLTTTNQTLANNSSRLIAFLEKKEKRITAGVEKENFLVAPETFQAFLEAICQVATGKKWHSKMEFEAALNKQIFDKTKGKQAKDIQTG